MNPHACTKCAGRLLMALAAITSILLMAACGSGSGLVTPLGGSFSNSSLSGTYVMKQTGYYLNSAGNGIPFSETTIFSANGKGALTVIEDDGGPQGPGSEMLAGSYGIERDGEGSLKFNNPSAISTYQITMIDTGHFYVVEGDSYASSSGYGVLQTSTATPSGTYVFKAHNFDTSSTVGVGTIISNGTFTGTQDILTLGGSNSAQAISGSVSTPNSSGVGTYTLNGPTGSSSGNYYVISSSEFYFMANPASGSLEIGQADAQTGTTLAAGTYVFGSRGDTINNQPGIHSTGVFTTDGKGNITSGTVDYIQDESDDNGGNGFTVNAGASYTLDPSGDGNGTITLPLSKCVTLSQIFWMVSPTSAYFLNNSPTAVEDGSFSSQTGTITTLSAQAAFVMDGVPDTPAGGQVGDFEPTTSGAFNWNEASNGYNSNTGSFGSVPIGTNGTYTVGSSGRVEVVVNNVAPELVFYLSSSTTGFIVEVDGTGDIGGVFTQQTSP